jgi:UDP-GlcNAc:undecaprenyl-phosphate/decaprenyl-phosphate GlcNAc-1-phosphate transferase
MPLFPAMAAAASHVDASRGTLSSLPFPWWTAVWACLFAVVLTPLVRRVAWRWEIVDRPDGHRKLHKEPVPLGGGVAVAAATFAALAGVFPGRTLSVAHSQFLQAFAAASIGICILGIIDDRWKLRGRQKLMGQIALVLLLVWGGLRIDAIEVMGQRIHLGLLAVPFTLFWLLGAINALNLIDGVDGLASSIGIIMSVTIGFMAWLGGHIVDAYCALALAGALAGFLVYNRPPARIYLGDAGSMLIGLILGTLAIRSSLKGPATVALAAPVTVWAVLFFDVGIAILRRKLTGQSIYATDRAHLHHLLLKRGYTAGRVVLVIGLLCIICALAAVASVVWDSELVALGIAAAVLATLVLTRSFGHSECRLLAQRTRGAAASILGAPLGSSPAGSRSARGFTEIATGRGCGSRWWSLPSDSTCASSS